MGLVPVRHVRGACDALVRGGANVRGVRQADRWPRPAPSLGPVASRTQVGASRPSSNYRRTEALWPSRTQHSQIALTVKSRPALINVLFAGTSRRDSEPAAMRTDPNCIQPCALIFEASALRRRASSAASIKRQSRNVLIFDALEITFGQTIQYVFCILSETLIGAARRPLMRSHAARAVRASAIPWPSMAASISMLAWFRTDRAQRDWKFRGHQFISTRR
jgi:hypothetical protein